jgi:subfamily B ATP-binding cassette protein MsbA
MPGTNEKKVSRRAKVNALLNVARFKPKFALLIVTLGLVVAVLEGVGLSFILPIIGLVQTENPVEEASGLMSVFVTIYRTLGIPFTLGFVVAGVAAVITVRYTTGFLVIWFGEALRTKYTRHLQFRTFNSTLKARIEYFDEEGSDDIINAIITQSFYAGRVIKRVVQFFQTLFISLVYLLVALVIAPVLTLFALVILGTLTVTIRFVLEPGYSIGERVADANEQRQEAVQAGTQGIREVRVLGLAEEVYGDFVKAVDRFTNARIKLRRNQAAIDNFYNLIIGISVFALIYFALAFAELSLGALGVFLFAMFQLGPKMSHLNETFYRIENDLPHLVRTQEFLRELENNEEPNEPTRNVPSEVEHIEFDDIWFSYNDEEQILRDINFEVRRGEFVAFVGQSGAGKSTIVSLLARFYEPDRGSILANGVPIDEMDAGEWREQIALVRQNPFIFNDTLRYNLTAGNRNATQEEIDRICEIAKIDEFFDDLEDGYETRLGDEGVRLSGGQKQRVAIARALLTDADLLILDEATSDLDSNLEKQVQRAIETMEQDYAMITIAHQLSTVKNADQIYTLEDGRIVETGRHRELLDNGGTYAELYTIQSEG